MLCRWTALPQVLESVPCRVVIAGVTNDHGIIDIRYRMYVVGYGVCFEASSFPKTPG